MSDLSSTTGRSSYNVVSAVFNDRSDAEHAVSWLRDNGVPDSAISIVAQHGGEVTGSGAMADDARDAGDTASDAGKGALTGLGIGAGVGALFGLGALLIPGAGPFITAGFLANALGTAGGAAAAGAIVGGTSGALAGALSHSGLNEAEAKYYAGEVERGGTFVGVDLGQTTVGSDTVMEAFRRYNGRFAS